MANKVIWADDFWTFKWMYKGILYDRMHGKYVMLVPKAIIATDANKVYNRACCLRR
jgi:uncharacterized membrane protein